MDIPKCIRCGMCCIITCCYDMDQELCPYLIVHKDLTTSCSNIPRRNKYIGTGCILRVHEEVYNTCMEYYQITARKQEIIQRLGTSEPKRL